MYGQQYAPGQDPSFGFPGQPPIDPRTGSPMVGGQQPVDPYTGAPMFQPPPGQPFVGQPPPGQFPPGGAPMFQPQAGGAPMLQPPPGQGYGIQPPMDLSGAEAHQAHLEAKKLRHDEKHKKDEVQKMAKTIKANARSQDNNKACAGCVCTWGLINVLLWAMPLLGDHWWNKTWHGMGLEKMTIDVGLFKLQVMVECATTMVNEERLCNAMRPYAANNGGIWPIQDLMEKSCRELPASCHIMQRMNYAGYIPLYAFPCAASLELLAVLCFYFYWYVKPSGMMRKVAGKLSATATLAGMLGLAGWTAVSPYLQELPRLWAAQAGIKEFANSVAVGLKDSFSLCTGWCFLLSVVVVLSSGIRCFSALGLDTHIHEPIGDGFDETSQLIEEVAANYDATHGYHGPAA